MFKEPGGRRWRQPSSLSTSSISPSLEGLLGIVRTKSLWATSIYYLNERLLGRVGVELLAHGDRVAALVRDDRDRTQEVGTERDPPGTILPPVGRGEFFSEEG